MGVETVKEAEHAEESGTGVPPVTEIKKQLVLDALNEADGNITEAARLLGIHGNNLHRLIRNLNLRDEIKKFGN